MKILMLGWEFPPFFAGGVGIVCDELTTALTKFKDVEISYVMPYGPHEKYINNNFKILNANSVKQEKININIKKIPSMIYAYDNPLNYEKKIKKLSKSQLQSKEKSIKEIYGENLIEEVYLYAHRVVELCKNSDFDVIHAHDWTTFPAATWLSKITGKPCILHVHITELDKTGGMGGHPKVFEIEKEGFNKADNIIAVSQFTKNRLINNYGVNKDKIEVIHNGGISSLKTQVKDELNFNKDEKIVLYAGRITLQKGVEYFIRSAKKVLEYNKKVKFVIAGNGDMIDEMKKLVWDLQIQDNIIFYGFYSREQAEELFSSANIFVMPSVSEPFGIVPLEAVAKGTPTIISKQSGISEVLDNTFKVDFWDIDEMADKILGLLNYPIINSTISENAINEISKFSWKKVSLKVYNLYSKIIKKNKK